MGLRNDELASIRQTVSEWLPESCTITRTGQTVACKLRDDGREVHIEGLPRALPLRRWRIKFHDAVDVQVWDELVIAGKGTYLATISANPASYSLSTTVYGVKSASVVASTQRGSGPKSLGLTSGLQPYLRHLTLRQLDSYLLMPVNEHWAKETFGTNATQVFRAFANVPAPSDFVDPSQSTKPYPVAVHDQLVLPDGTTKDVKTVELWTPRFLILYLM